MNAPVRLHKTLRMLESMRWRNPFRRAMALSADPPDSNFEATVVEDLPAALRAVAAVPRQRPALAMWAATP